MWFWEKVLLEAGADVEAVSAVGLTAFMAAALNGHSHTAEVGLLQVIHLNSSQATPWKFLIYRELVRLTLTSFLLCLLGKMILTAGASVDTMNTKGLAALMTAACGGSTQTVEVYLLVESWYRLPTNNALELFSIGCFSSWLLLTEYLLCFYERCCWRLVLLSIWETIAVRLH